MAVQKQIKIEAKYKHGHGVSQVTELRLSGGQMRQIGVEQKNGVLTLTIVGSEEMQSLIDGFISLKTPIYHEDPEAQAEKEAQAAADEKTKAEAYAKERAERSAALAKARDKEREAAKAENEAAGEEQGPVETAE